MAKTAKTYATIVMFAALLIALTSSIEAIAQAETATETTITEAQIATENATVTTVTVTMTETTTQYLYVPSVSTSVVTISIGIPVNSFIWASGLLLILGLVVGYILGVRSESRRIAAQSLSRPQKPAKPAKR